MFMLSFSKVTQSKLRRKQTIDGLCCELCTPVNTQLHKIHIRKPTGTKKKKLINKTLFFDHAVKSHQ